MHLKSKAEKGSKELVVLASSFENSQERALLTDSSELNGHLVKASLRLRLFTTCRGHARFGGDYKGQFISIRIADLRENIGNN